MSKRSISKFKPLKNWFKAEVLKRMDKFLGVREDRIEMFYTVTVKSLYNYSA